MTMNEPNATGPRPNEAPPELPEVQELRKALDQERARADGNMSGWQRAQADFSNYRRRIEQERADAARYAGAPIAAPVLAVVDDLERALAAVPPALATLTWVDGIYLIYRKLLSGMEAQGVREIPAQDQPFDPQLHEAVLHGEGPEGRVVQVLQKGYYLHDRVLRPAMVVVGNGTDSAAKDAGQEKSGAAKTESPGEGAG